MKIQSIKYHSLINFIAYNKNLIKFQASPVETKYKQFPTQSWNDKYYIAENGKDLRLEIRPGKMYTYGWATNKSPHVSGILIEVK